MTPLFDRPSPVHGEMLLKQQPEVGKDRHNTFARCNCAEEQAW
jgi:hypothetical protein